MSKETGTGRYNSHKEFVKEVNKRTNGQYEVIDQFLNNRTRMRFRCKHCGNIIVRKPIKFLAGQRCPKCDPKRSKRKSIKEMNNEELTNAVLDSIANNHYGIKVDKETTEEFK